MKKILFLILLPFFIYAQLPIEVVHSGNDPVGNILFLEVKRMFKESASYNYTVTSDTAFQIIFHTFDPMKDMEGAGKFTVFTWILVLKPEFYYYNSSIGRCGLNYINQGAKLVYGSIDEWIDAELKRINSESKPWEKYQK